MSETCYFCELLTVNINKSVDICMKCITVKPVEIESEET